jgi:phosphoribosylcarboxyaminoimidazole (NCAIR) mutase
VQKILILLAAGLDDKVTAEGQTLLRDFHVSYQLRVAAAQEAPDYVREIVTTFQKGGGLLILCVAPAEDRLASLVSSLVLLPVVYVVAQEDAVPLPRVSCPMLAGFSQAAQFALQMLALHDSELSQNLQRQRHSLSARMIAQDQKQQVIFDV